MTKGKTKGKQATLARTGLRDRTPEREAVAIPARCTIGERDEEEVLLTDLGNDSCRMQTSAVGVTKTEDLVLNMAGCAPIKGSLEWSKGGAFGVRFAKPLGDELLETLRREQSAQNVVPFRN